MYATWIGSSSREKWEHEKSEDNFRLLSTLYDSSVSPHGKIFWFLLLHIWYFFSAYEVYGSVVQVLELLCADQSESLSLWARHEATVSLDLDESGSSCEWTPNYGQGETDIQTHLALAMLGVDDDITSQCNSSMDIVHSSKYFEDYLEGRFSRSASFED